MSNTVVAELVTVAITGEPIWGEIEEILNRRTEDGVLFVDVRLTDGTVHEEVDAAVDIEVHARPDAALAAA